MDLSTQKQRSNNVYLIISYKELIEIQTKINRRKRLPCRRRMTMLESESLVGISQRHVFVGR